MLVCAIGAGSSGFASCQGPPARGNELDRAGHCGFRERLRAGRSRELLASRGS